MKRWLVAFLLTLFCFDTLPVLEGMKHACTWMADDATDAEDDGGEESAPLEEKEESVAKWWKAADAQNFPREHYEEEIRTALHNVEMRVPAVDEDVVAPPPDAVV